LSFPSSERGIAVWVSRFIERRKMDRYKFRGLRTDNGEEVKGSLFIPKCCNEGYAFIIPNDVEGPKKAYFVEVHPDTIGQYIGRVDVAGNEIYKDDIMQNRQRESSKGVVVIDEKGYHLKKPHGDGQRYYCGCIWYTENWLVIGTIHDNTDKKGDSDERD